MIGERGILEEVEEFRLEMVCPKSKLDRIVRALWDSHPYEEVAYDLYPLAPYKSESHFLWKGSLTRSTRGRSAIGAFTESPRVLSNTAAP